MRTRLLLPSLLTAAALALSACTSSGADTAGEESTADAVTFTHPTLDDVFLELTGRSLRES